LRCCCGELLAFGFEDRNERVLRIASYKEGVVVRQERNKMRETVLRGRGRIIWRVYRRDARLGAGKERIYDLAVKGGQTACTDLKGFRLSWTGLAWL
jgi:hypothetical protein